MTNDLRAQVSYFLLHPGTTGSSLERHLKKLIKGDTLPAVTRDGVGQEPWVK